MDLPGYYKTIGWDLAQLYGEGANDFYAELLTYPLQNDNDNLSTMILIHDSQPSLHFLM
jgi:hypothetical protein